MSRRLRALRVGNFKAFADTQRIPLKPITLIFGPNSAGKSSFIHSLALAHEAQFGREKRSLGRLDVHHTDVGGSAIDLGGFRQYVHRGQLQRRVEWGAELNVSELAASKDARLAQLLAPLSIVALNIAFGIEVDDQDRPKPGAEPRVDAIEIRGDGAELLRMSGRPLATKGQGQVSALRLDRVASDHPVFRQVLKAIVETATTSSEMRPEDFDGANEAIAGLLPELLIRVEQFFPAAVELPQAEGVELSPVSMLFAVSKGNRKDDIGQAVRFYLPRTLNDLIKGLADALADELKKLQYLGPLRSFPPRHLAFAEQEDSNWYAGGGYAWDSLRRNDEVREAVNTWLSSDKLKTPYKLVVRSLVALDQLHAPLERGLEEIQDGGLDMEPDYDGKSPDPVGVYPVIKEIEAETKRLMSGIDTSDADRVRELVLIDQRANTVVTHRDVGIGISQVLPVLVMAYGSQGALLAMEQPEIHLHPALQAELGDVFIETALGHRQNTFILETHSEHLILRVMRRMRESYQRKETGLPSITPADVCVLYVEPDGMRSIVREMPLNELGELVKSWPGGFFEEGLREQFGDA
jgi:AAA ATPase domain/AAA domain